MLVEEIVRFGYESPMTGMAEQVKGQAWALFAYDVGYSIALSQCRDRLTEANAQMPTRSRRSPIDFGPEPRPMIWDGPSIQHTVLGRSVQIRYKAVIYELGAISFSLNFDFEGTIAEWRDLSAEVIWSETMPSLAQKELEALVERIRGAITGPRIAKIDENYFIFQLQPNADVLLDTWLDQNRMHLAQVIRGETELLSADEVDECLRKRVSYGPRDCVIVDWAAALVIDAQFQDTLAVLDFANVELLEMRVLDSRLDDMVEEAYRMVRSKRFPWRLFINPYGKSVHRLVELMADAASEFEAVNNSVKLTNDQYLARIYRLVGERFHLSAFEADIKRKLDTLWDIHGVFIDRMSNRRQEILEWIIIGLIFLEIVLYFDK